MGVPTQGEFGRRVTLALCFFTAGALGACANIWGFQDSVLEDGGVASIDGTTPDTGGTATDSGADAPTVSCGGSICAGGQHCQNNVCVCDQTSCPTGCCDTNQQCQPGTATTACGTSGSTCAPCPTGQSCSNGACSGCSQTCPTGCCVGSQCTPYSKGACGPPGTGCVACIATSADNCSSAGVCQCGTSAACAPGQGCVNSQCICDPTTCPTGCCDANNKCQQPSPATCGTQGVTCVNCATVGGDTCNQGQCQCGSGGFGSQLCSAGTVCEDGGCVCNAATCPTSCCDQGGGSSQQCEDRQDDNHCGTGGIQCVQCGGSTHCLDAGCH